MICNFWFFFQLNFFVNFKFTLFWETLVTSLKDFSISKVSRFIRLSCNWSELLPSSWPARWRRYLLQRSTTLATSRNAPCGVQNGRHRCQGEGQQTLTGVTGNIAIEDFNIWIFRFASEFYFYFLKNDWFILK